LLNTILGSFSTGVAPVTTSYESIATVTVGGGGAATVDFTSIPSTYTHLQIRGIAYCNSGVSLRLRINSDSGSNYSTHYLNGNGSSTGAGGAASQTSMFAGSAGNTANIFGGNVIDILEYTSTSKYKTIRTLSGIDSNGGGFVQFMSGAWLNTSAITSIAIYGESDLNQYSSFALYGIKGS
jgi:hypothetical protein